MKSTILWSRTTAKELQLICKSSQSPSAEIYRMLLLVVLSIWAFKLLLSIAVGLTNYTLQFTHVYGSSIDFQWAVGRYNMWGVIMRSGYHPSVESGNQNSLCENLLVGNVPWAAVFF